MKGTAGGVALAGEPLLKQALEAVRAHQKAVKDDAFAGEIEKASPAGRFSFSNSRGLPAF